MIPEVILEKVDYASVRFPSTSPSTGGNSEINPRSHSSNSRGSFQINGDFIVPEDRMHDANEFIIPDENQLHDDNEFIQSILRDFETNTAPVDGPHNESVIYKPVQPVAESHDSFNVYLNETIPDIPESSSDHYLHSGSTVSSNRGGGIRNTSIEIDDGSSVSARSRTPTPRSSTASQFSSVPQDTEAGSENGISSQEVERWSSVSTPEKPLYVETHGRVSSDCSTCGLTPPHRRNIPQDILQQLQSYAFTKVPSRSSSERGSLSSDINSKNSLEKENGKPIVNSSSSMTSGSTPLAVISAGSHSSMIPIKIPSSQSKVRPVHSTHVATDDKLIPSLIRNSNLDNVWPHVRSESASPPYSIPHQPPPYGPTPLEKHQEPKSLVSNLPVVSGDFLRSLDQSSMLIDIEEEESDASLVNVDPDVQELLNYGKALRDLEEIKYDSDENIVVMNESPQVVRSRSYSEPNISLTCKPIELKKYDRCKIPDSNYSKESGNIDFTRSRFHSLDVNRLDSGISSIPVDVDSTYESSRFTDKDSCRQENTQHICCCVGKDSRCPGNMSDNSKFNDRTSCRHGYIPDGCDCLTDSCSDINSSEGVADSYQFANVESDQQLSCLQPPSNLSPKPNDGENNIFLHTKQYPVYETNRSMDLCQQDRLQRECSPRLQQQDHLPHEHSPRQQQEDQMRHEHSPHQQQQERLRHEHSPRQQHQDQMRHEYSPRQQQDQRRHEHSPRQQHQDQMRHEYSPRQQQDQRRHEHSPRQQHQDQMRHEYSPRQQQDQMRHEHSPQQQQERLRHEHSPRQQQGDQIRHEHSPRQQQLDHIRHEHSPRQQQQENIRCEYLSNDNCEYSPPVLEDISLRQEHNSESSPQIRQDDPLVSLDNDAEMCNERQETQLQVYSRNDVCDREHVYPVEKDSVNIFPKPRSITEVRDQSPLRVAEVRDPSPFQRQSKYILPTPNTQRQRSDTDHVGADHIDYKIVDDVNVTSYFSSYNSQEHLCDDTLGLVPKDPYKMSRGRPKCPGNKLRSYSCSPTRSPRPVSQLTLPNRHCGNMIVTKENLNAPQYSSNLCASRHKFSSDSELSRKSDSEFTSNFQKSLTVSRLPQIPVNLPLPGYIQNNNLARVNLPEPAISVSKRERIWKLLDDTGDRCPERRFDIGGRDNDSMAIRRENNFLREEIASLERQLQVFFIYLFIYFSIQIISYNKIRHLKKTNKYFIKAYFLFIYFFR